MQSFSLLLTHFLSLLSSFSSPSSHRPSVLFYKTFLFFLSLLSFPFPRWGWCSYRVLAVHRKRPIPHHGAVQWSRHPKPPCRYKGLNWTLAKILSLSHTLPSAFTLYFLIFFHTHTRTLSSFLFISKYISIRWARASQCCVWRGLRPSTKRRIRGIWLPLGRRSRSLSMMTSIKDGGREEVLNKVSFPFLTNDLLLFMNDWSVGWVDASACKSVCECVWFVCFTFGDVCEKSEERERVCYVDFSNVSLTFAFNARFSSWKRCLNNFPHTNTYSLSHTSTKETKIW